MNEIVIVIWIVWIALYWGDVLCTRIVFNKLKKIKPKATFDEYEMNQLAIVLTRNFGYYEAAVLLFCVGLFLMVILYSLGFPVIALGLIGGMYLTIYQIHIVSYYRVKKEAEKRKVCL